MKSYVSVVMLSVCAFALAGDDAVPSEKPKSPAAVNAMTKRDIAVNRAQLECKRAVAAADKQLVIDLDVAMKVALKSGNVEEVKRIDAAKTEAAARLHDADPPGVLTLAVSAHAAWIPAGKFRKGQTLHITARGKWCVRNTDREHWTSDASGLEMPVAGSIGYLEAKVGQAQPQRINAEADYVVPEDGTLMLECHDSDEAHARDDNDGSITVSIRVAPTESQ